MPVGRDPTAGSESEKAMFRKIVVAVEGTGASEPALHRAIALAREQQARLAIVHVVHDTGGCAAQTSLAEIERQDEQRRAAGRAILLAADVSAREAGIEPELRLLQAAPKEVAATVLGDAERWHADL